MTNTDIQSINVNQITRRDGLQNFSTVVSNLQSALKSRNQDRVTLSENALSQALDQGVALPAPPLNECNPGTRVSADEIARVDAFKNDLSALQSALNSMDGSQNASSNSTMESALHKFLNDMPLFMRKPQAGANNTVNISA